MLFRTLAYVMLGWVLLATVAGVVPVLQLTVMLPSTTAILLTHFAFEREDELHWGLGAAVFLGYLEDVHQGAPIGMFSLSHGVAFLVAWWAAGRLALPGIWARVAACAATSALVAFVTWVLLTVFAERLAVSREALNAALWQERWHVIATALAAHPVWMLTDKVLQWLRLDRPRVRVREEPEAVIR